MPDDPAGWQFWIDRGGTFTDVVARDPRGSVHALKLLSDNPTHYEDAALEGIRRFLDAAAPSGGRIDAIKMGTTVGTNALLERNGEPTALVVTKGLKDAIRIGSQARPSIFALAIQLPEMLYDLVVEADERLSADGEVIEPLDEPRLTEDLAAARERGIDSLAVVLMHGYRYTAHERRVAEIARLCGFGQVSVSHEANPLMRLISRGNTTLVDAYLSPVLNRYVRRLREGLGDAHADATLWFMQSHGGLVGAGAFQGKDCVLSGPAGGVVGMAATAEEAGFDSVIGFDMGGTSTDVSLFDGELKRSTDETVAGFRVSAPMLEIHTVAAGGGSILRFENGRLQVGPDSAGAFPGPACYRNGGPLTVTDANVFLGRIQADYFPRVFGPGADEPIDTERVQHELGALAERVSSESEPLDAERLAAGFVRVAVERMANAVKQISIQRGYDAGRFALCCFGGAAGQHACQVADALGIDTVVIHRLAGVLSAYGMGVADIRSLHQQTLEADLDDAGLGAAAESADRLERAARADLIGQNVAAGDVELASSLRLKIRGSDTALSVDWRCGATLAACRDAFDRAHAQHFGFGSGAADLVIESVEVEGVGAMPRPTIESAAGRRGRARPAAHRRVWLDDAWAELPVYERRTLGPGRLDGPALIVEDNATTLVESDWEARIDERGDLILTRSKARSATETIRVARDPIMLEVFNGWLMHVAEEMGAILINTAHSINIKERADFSCAIFDAGGELIANAPHVPVHLGSMGASVRTILDRVGTRLAPGDVYMLNDPYNGGTHLPDITVVSPVFDPSGSELRFVVANRAHHADVGGLTPGSMPADSRTIHDEGIVFDQFLAVSGGRFREAGIRNALAASAHPARNPGQNIADLKAQLAANVRGARELTSMVERFGLDVVSAYMRYIKDNAEESVRAAIETLSDGAWTLELDGGERIAVEIRIDPEARSAVIDFDGTSTASAGNFNAPASVARAVILYVFRSLLEQDIPLNDGCLKPLSIVLPEGSLVNPVYPAAVAAGNVETSQCIADALLAALGACAASQGTMNNFSFGNEDHQYYETICGGAGAGPAFDGASAVHTHMTNSRLTDPEVLEWRYPVRLRRFEIRQGTGGGGAHRGGNGIVRELEFLEPAEAAIISNRRRIAPFGLDGGGDGAPGRNSIIRASGSRELLAPTAQFHVDPGDRVVIETPGGGGYGRPPDGE